MSDSISLLANASYSLDIFRRKSFKNELKDEFASLCNDGYPVRGMLFGENMTEKIKEVNEYNKVARSTRRFNPYTRPKPRFPFPFLEGGPHSKFRGAGNAARRNTYNNHQKLRKSKQKWAPKRRH